MTADILCLGEPMLEFNRLPDGLYLSGHGGDTSNCAIAAARQSASAGYFTHVGADPFGKSFIELWNAEGVDASSVKQVGDAPTGVYFVTHGPDGHEFSYFRKGPQAVGCDPRICPVTR